MTQLNIQPTLCKGCGLCLKSCASGALSLQGKLAQVNDACILCGLCIKTCPFGALSIEHTTQGTKDLTLYRDLWVFIECTQGAIAPVSLELLGIGRQLADEKGCQLVAVVLDQSADAHGQTLIGYGADQVLCCQEQGLTTNSQHRCVEILQALISQRKPEILLFGATGFGRSFAPSVAAQVQTGLTADCTVLEIDGETKLLRQTRPAFGGNLMATIVCPSHRPQLASVRPGVMAMGTFDPHRTGTIVPIVPTVSRVDDQVELLETCLSQAVNGITQAQRLVVVGRGIGSKKNMKLVYAFAEKIGAQVAVSRPLVDMGYAPYVQQVGQTGCTVAPALLISLGVSGAIQHLAGISRAETIVAINTDDQAPIFNISQYKIVGDCLEILKNYCK